MVNEVKLTATITDEPVAIEAKKDPSKGVLGYRSRCRYTSPKGAGYIDLNQWSPTSPLATMKVGDEVLITGALSMRSWENGGGGKSYATSIEVTSCAITQPSLA